MGVVSILIVKNIGHYQYISQSKPTEIRFSADLSKIMIGLFLQ